MTEPSSPADPGDLSRDDADLDSSTPQATKTPLFQANHAGRYQRQTLIKQIQHRTRRILIAKTLKTDPENVAARIMLGKLDPAILKLCEAAVDRARQTAEKLLTRGMFRSGGNYTKTVTELLDTARWLSHGQMISWEDARDPQIGLVVEYCAYHSEVWQDYWRLYCLQTACCAGPAEAL